MRKRTNRILILLIAVPLFVIAPLGTVFAQSKQSVPRDGKQQLTDAQVKQLLLLMDTDKNGMVSKQEWMNFMSAEFDRLDTDKSGQLSPKELTQSRLRASTFPRAAGK